MFSLLIILASFLPVFFLEDREARLFDPLAYSKTFAMAFSTLLTLFLLPAIAVWIFERESTSVHAREMQSRCRKKSRRGRLARILAALAVLLVAAGLWRFAGSAREFLPEIVLLSVFTLIALVYWLYRRRRGDTGTYQDSTAVHAYRSALALHDSSSIRFHAGRPSDSDSGAVLLSSFQRDFLPETDEGSILYMPTTLPGLPTREAGWVLQQMDKKLKEIPEVDSVFGKLGRADTSTDPAPVSMVETTILLKPRSEWRPGMTKGKLVAEMDSAMNIIGYVNTWVQPIRARVMMQSTGIQTPVGIKVKGPALANGRRDLAADRNASS